MSFWDKEWTMATGKQDVLGQGKGILRRHKTSTHYYCKLHVHWSVPNSARYK